MRGSLRRLALSLGARPWFAPFVRRFGARADRALYRASRGRLSVTGSVAPVALLTTTGRRTGRARTTPVIYVRDGNDFLISSEDFGTARPSAWPGNLDADPDATLQVGADIILCRARRLPDAEADRHWPRLVEAWPAHEAYRRRNGRRHTFLLVRR